MAHTRHSRPFITIEVDGCSFLEPAALTSDVEFPMHGNVADVEDDVLHVAPDEGAAGQDGDRGQVGRLNVQQHPLSDRHLSVNRCGQFTWGMC